MSEQVPHTLETCIFSGSFLQLVNDEVSRKILTVSPDVENLVQKQSQPDNCKSEQSTESNQDLVGNFVHDIITVDDSREGVILPTEISRNQNNDSKWVFSCMHKSTINGQPVEIRFIEDPSGLKSFYNSSSRSPLPIDQIKKVSTSIPDFVLDNKFELGEISSIRLGRNNRITSIFPYNDFLGIPLIELFRANLLSLIHEEDHVTLLQSLSESVTKGSAHAVVRFLPTNSSNPIWVQVQSTREADINEPTIICVILQLKDTTQSTGYFSSAFSMISSKSAQVLAASQHFTFGSPVRTFNNFMNRPVLDKLDSQEEPKMYLILI